MKPKITIRRRITDGWWNVAHPDRPGGKNPPGMVFETWHDAIAAATATPEQLATLALDRLDFCEVLNIASGTITRQSGLTKQRLGYIRRYRRMDTVDARRLLAVKPVFDEDTLIRVEWTFMRGVGLGPDEARDRLSTEYGWDHDTIKRAARGAHAGLYAA